jgi:site-specific recombinase XerD
MLRYRSSLTSTRSPATVQIYARWIRQFLWSIQSVHPSLSSVTVESIDQFIDRKVSEGAKPCTIGSVCQALRSFFAFTYRHGTTPSEFAGAIRSPAISHDASGRSGPRWRDVRRLLASFQSGRAADVRARALLFLFAIYALRISEVVNLKLADVDWANETLTVRRAKNSLVQVFPLQYEVGEALMRYITRIRPRCSSRLVFVTLSSPYRQLNIASVSNLIRNRMERLHIDAPLKTPHALRHACATQLLHAGSSLPEIADFLGHRSLNAVSTYVKCSRQSLRRVANFSLSGVL